MWVCERCGSEDVQTMMWVGVNTNEVFEHCHSWNWEEANFCDHCAVEDVMVDDAGMSGDGHTTLVSKEEYEKAAEVKEEIARHTTMEVKDGREEG